MQPEQLQQGGIDNLQLRWVVADQELRQQVRDLGHKVRRLLANGGQIANRLFADGYIFVFEQIDERIDALLRVRREVLEELRYELTSQTLLVRRSLDSLQNVEVVGFVLNRTHGVRSGG